MWEFLFEFDPVKTRIDRQPLADIAVNDKIRHNRCHRCNRSAPPQLKRTGAANWTDAPERSASDTGVL